MKAKTITINGIKVRFALLKNGKFDLGYSEDGKTLLVAQREYNVLNVLNKWHQATDAEPDAIPPRPLPRRPRRAFRWHRDGGRVRM